MFAAILRLRVFSEPPALDHVVQARWQGPEISTETHARWLRYVATALAQSGEGDGAPYILKLDSWHVHELPVIMAAFPETPWIFLTRDANEVAASQLRSPGLQGAPGAMDPRILRMAAEDITRVPRAEWPLRVVEKFMEAANAHREGARALFLDYRELPDAIWERAAPHFGIELTPEERDRMREAARYEAKEPGVLYRAS
jgi:hypothetical protein